MGHFGFSYIGLTFLLMLTVSNLIWTKHKPKDYAVRKENRIFLVFERVGQVCVTIYNNIGVPKKGLYDVHLTCNNPFHKLL